MTINVEEILAENRRRLLIVNSPYDPIAGDRSDRARTSLDIAGLSEGTLWIPKEMAGTSLVGALKRAGSVDNYIRIEMHATPSDSLREKVIRDFISLRILHDFPFWAASFVYIKRKGGGDDILFTLNRPQRRLVAILEGMRREGRPIRLVLLKARQWGGSTCVQLYMASDGAYAKP